jgi:hypothetical protein
MRLIQNLKLYEPHRPSCMNLIQCMRGLFIYESYMSLIPNVCMGLNLERTPFQRGHGGGGLLVAAAPGGRPGSPARRRLRSCVSASLARSTPCVCLRPRRVLHRSGNNNTTLQCGNDLKSGTRCSLSPPPAVPSELHAVLRRMAPSERARMLRRRGCAPPAVPVFKAPPP